MTGVGHIVLLFYKILVYQLMVRSKLQKHCSLQGAACSALHLPHHPHTLTHGNTPPLSLCQGIWSATSRLQDDHYPPPACCTMTAATIKQHPSSREQLHTGGGVKALHECVCVCVCVFGRCPSALRALEGDAKNANEANHQSKD